MGNAVGSLFSGLGGAVGSLLGHPLDFLSGKSCSSVCGPTWDLFCYIENFCVSQLLKMASLLILVYLVLLYFYLLYKLHICQCVVRCICNLLWACIVSWVSFCNFICTFLCHKAHRLRRVRRARRRRQLLERLTRTESELDDESFSHRLHRHRLDRASENSVSGRWRDYRGDHLRKSLRPRSHRMVVGVSRREGGSGYSRRRHGKRVHHASVVHHIRVTPTSKFANKGRTSYSTRIHRTRRS